MAIITCSAQCRLILILMHTYNNTYINIYIYIGINVSDVKLYINLCFITHVKKREIIKKRPNLAKTQ